MNRRMIAGTAAALLAAVLFLPVRANALSAQKAIVLDAATGRVIYERNADQRSLIASTTKIMTALIICQRCNVLDRVKIPAEAVGVEGSSMYLEAGEVLTVQELLYGLMLRSGKKKFHLFILASLLRFSSTPSLHRKAAEFPLIPE